jgi:type VI protein secretion system component Hcp
MASCPVCILVVHSGPFVTGVTFHEPAPAMETANYPSARLQLGKIGCGERRIQAEIFAMKTFILSVAAVLLFAATAMAQGGPFGRRSTITVTVNGLNCSTSLGAGIFSALTWAFDSTESVSSGGSGSGAGAGKVTNGATITKRADACTPQLFEAAVEGKAFGDVIVTHQDDHGHTYKITLKNVLISSYELQGEQSEARPSEKISFAFESLTIVF